MLRTKGRGNWLKGAPAEQIWDTLSITRITLIDCKTQNKGFHESILTLQMEQDGKTLNKSMPTNEM